MYSKEVNLFEEAKKSRKLPNIVWAIVLTMTFIYGGQILSLFTTNPVGSLLTIIPYFKNNLPLVNIFIHMFGGIVIILLVFFRVSKIEKRKIATLGLYKQGWIKKYCLGLLIGLVMMSIVVLLSYMFGCVVIEKPALQPIGAAAIIPLIIIFIGRIFQAASEEVVTRGWLMHVLGAKYNIATGLIVSSSLFGALHLLNPDVNYIALVNIILAGLFFGILVIKTSDLWIACAIHTAWNFAQGNIFGFKVSGLDVGVGTLVDLKLVGNQAISGGDFGPEAGLCATIVLIISIIIVSLIKKKSSTISKI